MIPIRDAIRSKNFPAVNFIIIGLNIIVFLWQLLQGPHLKEVLYLYGMVPLRYPIQNSPLTLQGSNNISLF